MCAHTIHASKIINHMRKAASIVFIVVSCNESFVEFAEKSLSLTGFRHRDIDFWFCFIISFVFRVRVCLSSEFNSSIHWIADVEYPNEFHGFFSSTHRFRFSERKPRSHICLMIHKILNIQMHYRCNLR